MHRSTMLRNLKEQDTDWDIAIVGGGATGVGVAIDAASRGYRTILVEQSDFGKGTSSRSTKLIHGGVRYLRQGNISLVLEALQERGILYRNAPHLVHNLPFVVPHYDWWEGPFYGIGLKLYDLLAGKEGFGHSELLSLEETISKIPTIETEGLRGGVIYYDGQFDDARLNINMVRTAHEQGATLLNYMRVDGLIKNNHYTRGINAVDLESGQSYQIGAKVVINATGAFVDQICQMDDAQSAKMIQPSQGVHIVLDRSFLPANNAIMIPQTDDGRVLFAIPWNNRVIIGTTDTPVESVALEPRALPEELDFLLSHAARYLTKDPSEKDVLSVFAGLRPLAATDPSMLTSALSRDHHLHISGSGLLTITGGKWTTYRKMAEDTVEQAIILGGLNARTCVTKQLHIHGYHQNVSQFGSLAVYGTDATGIRALMQEDDQLAHTIHPALPYTAAEIIWAVRTEMARTIDDVLCRRTRSVLINAQATLDCATKIAEILAREMNKNRDWIDRQLADFEKIAGNYILTKS